MMPNVLLIGEAGDAGIVTPLWPPGIVEAPERIDAERAAGMAAIKIGTGALFESSGYLRGDVLFYSPAAPRPVVEDRAHRFIVATDTGVLTIGVVPGSGQVRASWAIEIIHCRAGSAA